MDLSKIHGTASQGGHHPTPLDVLHRTRDRVAGVSFRLARRAGSSRGGVCGSTRPAPDGRSPCRSAQPATRPRARQRRHHPGAGPHRASGGAAVQRGPAMPSVRTKFQVVALLVREERARVKADATHDRGPTGRPAQAPGRGRDDPRDDGRPRHARCSRCSPRTQSSPTRPSHSGATCSRWPGIETAARGGRARRSRPHLVRQHRAPGRTAVGRLATAGQPVPRTGLQRRRADQDAAAPTGRLGAARSAPAVVRGGRQRCPACMALPEPTSLRAPGTSS